MRLVFLFVVFTTCILGIDIDEKKEEKKDKDYIVRVYYGEAVASTLAEIVTGGDIRDPHQQNALFGFSAEKYFKRNLFKLPINLTYQGSFFVHHQSYSSPDAPYQEPFPMIDKDAYQINIGLKAYWTKFPWNKIVRTRFSFMEGISYTSNYLNIENENYNRKGRTHQSKFLNYLEFNLAFNMEDITRNELFRDSYLGIGISHRSGIFGLINGVNGGSNIIVMTIEKEF
jgi:outer membrane protein